LLFCAISPPNSLQLTQILAESLHTRIMRKS